MELAHLPNLCSILLKDIRARLNDLAVKFLSFGTDLKHTETRGYNTEYSSGIYLPLSSSRAHYFLPRICHLVTSLLNNRPLVIGPVFDARLWLTH